VHVWDLEYWNQLWISQMYLALLEETVIKLLNISPSFCMKENKFTIIFEFIKEILWLEDFPHWRWLSREWNHGDFEFRPQSNQKIVKFLLVFSKFSEFIVGSNHVLNPDATASNLLESDIHKQKTIGCFYRIDESTQRLEFLRHYPWAIQHKVVFRRSLD